tara:strand:+ start:3779 stop:4045 length:267 start_codon:yes stop_codon:yes gene_type:complete
MDFNRYRTNLTGQLSKINNEIIELEENLTQLKELRARVRGGLEVLDQLEKDEPEEVEPPTVQRQIQEDIEELIGAKVPARHGKDMDTM